jgi:hypothetical protein
MATVGKKGQKQQGKRPPNEKPISLAGAKFTDILKALLQTKPMPKEKIKGKS